MNTAAERLDRLRRREWHELYVHGRSCGRSVRNASIAQVRRHPVAALGFAAVVGLGVFLFARRSASLRLEAQLEARKPQRGVSSAPDTRGLLSQTLGNAARAWIVHRMTQKPAAHD